MLPRCPWWWALSLLGCAAEDAGPVGYDRIAEECPLVAPDGGPPVATGGVMQPVTEDCAEVVGRMFRFDWDSFGEVPGTFADPQTPAELTIAGLLVLSGTQAMTAAELREEPAPSRLSGWLGGAAVEGGVASDDDAGPMIFEFAREAITTIEYNGITDYLMAYGEGGAVKVGDITGVNDDDDGFLSVASDGLGTLPVATVLLHEAAHGYYGGHDASCSWDEEGERCDATREGAYGTGVWWLWIWLGRNAERLGDDAYLSTVTFWSGQCMMIDDVDSWLPCDEDP